MKSIEIYMRNLLSLLQDVEASEQAAWHERVLAAVMLAMDLDSVRIGTQSE